MLFGVGCTPDGNDSQADSEEAVITVTPETIASTLEGGEHELTVTSNAAWTVLCEQDGVEIEPLSGNGDGKVTVTILAAEADRNFTINFKAQKQTALEGIEFTSYAEASVTVHQNAAGSDKIQTNVKTIRNLIKDSASSTKAAVPAEVAAMDLIGVIAGSGKHGNMGSNKAVAIQDDTTEPGSGLTLFFSSNVDIAHGSIVKISLAAAQSQVYNNLLQIDPGTTTFEVIGTTELSPIAITYDQYTQYESQYVKLSGVQPQAAGVVWNDQSANYKTHSFLTEAGESFLVYVSKFAAFASETIPNMAGSIAGIATVFKSDKQLLPQSASDIQLTEEIKAPETTTATIAEITKAGLYKVENAWVVATYSKGCLLTDASGKYILAYSPTTTPAAGTVISVEGTVGEYGGCLQFNQGATITATSETKAVTHPTATALDGAAMDAYFSAPAVKYAEFTGVLTVSGNYYNVTVDGATVVGSISNPNTDMAETLKTLAGAAVKATGYLIGTSTSNGVNYVNMMAISVAADTTTPAIYANDITGVSAAGEVDATANITIVAIESVNATFDGTVVTDASVSGNVLTYTVSENTTAEAREGWIKLSAEGIEDVTITVKQKGVSSGNGKFVEVTSAPTDWSGKYLIVFGSNAHGTINGKDLKDTEAVTITNGEIASTETLINGASVTVEKSNNSYSILLSSSDKYLSLAKNSCAESTTPVEWTIEYTASGVKLYNTNAISDSDTNTYILYSNSGNYFRCYVDKTGNSAYTLPKLYKYVE